MCKSNDNFLLFQLILKKNSLYSYNCKKYAKFPPND